jgi:hypothetical protein
MSEQDPSNAEVEQYELPSLPVVPVTVDGPVRTVELPSVTQGIGLVHLNTTGQLLLAADPRRKRATILPLDTGIVLSHSQAGLVNGAKWLVNVPLVLDTADAVWAKCAETVQLTETDVSVIIEGWA